MGSYQYAAIHQRGAAIELQITDPSTANQLLDALSTLAAGFGASACKLPGEDFYYWRLYGLGENVESTWTLIVEQFCAYGWASVDDPAVSSQNADRVLCLGRDDTSDRWGYAYRRTLEGRS